MTPYVKEQESYKEAERKIEAELQELSIRLNNSVPFFNFRCQANTFTHLGLYLLLMSSSCRVTCCGTRP